MVPVFITCGDRAGGAAHLGLARRERSAWSWTVLLSGVVMLAARGRRRGDHDGREVAGRGPDPRRRAPAVVELRVAHRGRPTPSPRWSPAPWFANASAGTPALAMWLRSLGATIGRGVWCDTYWLPEPDLVTLGDGATVNRGCVVQTHLFHDRVMSMDAVTIEAGGTLGPHSVVLPGATIGAHATVGPGVAGDARRVGAGRQPLERQPDRALARGQGAGLPGATHRDGRRRTPPRAGTRATACVEYELTCATASPRTGWTGTAVIAAVATEPLTALRFDLVGLRASRVRVDGEKRHRVPAGRPQAPRHAGDRRSRPGSSSQVVVALRRRARGPRSSRWGEIGWEELDDGVLVASQPIGAPTWFPCNDRPADKARYRIELTVEDGLHGRRDRRAASRPPSSAGRATWTFEQERADRDLPGDGADRSLPLRERSARAASAAPSLSRRARGPRAAPTSPDCRE